MKKHLVIIFCILILVAKLGNAQANVTLSNLSSPTAVSQSLIPGTDNTFDLGIAGGTPKQWQDLFLSNTAFFTQLTTDAFIYYNGNKFINTVGGNNQSLYVGELAGQNAKSTAEVNNGCVGIGYKALNTLGAGWTIGSTEGVGNHNTAVGWRSLSNVNGDMDEGNADKNTMVGSRAGELISSGKENIGLGWNVFFHSSGDALITGTGNIGIGAADNPSGSVFDGVLGDLTSGNYNLVVGYASGIALNSGGSNIIIGKSSGNTITTTDDNIIIGNSLNPTLTPPVSNLNIGGTIYGDLANDKISIGNNGASIASMFNVGNSDQFQVNSSGIIPKYKNISTVGNGVPAEYAEVNLTGETSSITETTLYSVPNTEGGLYRINYTIKITNTTATTSIVKIQFKYTDYDDNIEVTLPSNDINGINQLQTNSTTTGYIGGCYFVNAKGNTAIKYLTNHADAGGVMTYSLHLLVEKL